jgi:hypothetical protein
VVAYGIVSTFSFIPILGNLFKENNEESVYFNWVSIIVCHCVDYLLMSLIDNLLLICSRISHLIIRILCRLVLIPLIFLDLPHSQRFLLMSINIWLRIITKVIVSVQSSSVQHCIFAFPDLLLSCRHHRFSHNLDDFWLFSYWLWFFTDLNLFWFFLVNDPIGVNDILEAFDVFSEWSLFERNLSQCFLSMIL